MKTSGVADEDVWHVWLVHGVGSEDVLGIADGSFATRHISRPSKVLTSASELWHNTNSGRSNEDMGRLL